jgi:hypothetical protein
VGFIFIYNQGIAQQHRCPQTDRNTVNDRSSCLTGKQLATSIFVFSFMLQLFTRTGRKMDHGLIRPHGPDGILGATSGMRA